MQWRCTGDWRNSPTILNLSTRWKWVLLPPHMEYGPQYPLHKRVYGPTHCIRDCVDPRSGLNITEKRKSLAPAGCQTLPPQLSSPQPSHHMECAILAPFKHTYMQNIRKSYNNLWCFSSTNNGINWQKYATGDP